MRAWWRLGRACSAGQVTRRAPVPIPDALGVLIDARIIPGSYTARRCSTAQRGSRRRERGWRARSWLPSFFGVEPSGAFVARVVARVSHPVHAQAVTHDGRPRWHPMRLSKHRTCPITQTYVTHPFWLGKRLIPCDPARRSTTNHSRMRKSEQGKSDRSPDQRCRSADTQRIVNSWEIGEATAMGDSVNRPDTVIRRGVWRRHLGVQVSRLFGSHVCR